MGICMNMHNKLCMSMRVSMSMGMSMSVCVSMCMGMKPKGVYERVRCV